MEQDNKHIGKAVIILIFIVLAIVEITCSVLAYNYFNFNATVTNMYTEDIPGEWIVFKKYTIETDAWFGSDSFNVEQNIYDKIKVGETYSFKREFPLTNYLDIRSDKK